ncbi:MAG TPA: winged helix DNA-binding domain-containing protein [Acidimicrobiia bacterium]|nr:winged helix DNA-binding domain-containing protein [Acidimicrobiia bacterium]
MTPLVLTTRSLNRALLARQLLLDRSSLSLVRALERVGGLQTQYAPSAYIALWSRLSGFRRDQLTRALMSRRAVQGTLMRSTIHIVSTGDYSLFAAGLRRIRREWWLRAATARRLEAADYQQAASILRRELAAGPRPRDELIAALGRAGLSKEAWEGAGTWVDMVRVPPSGTWERRRADLFGLADEWLGPASVSEAEGLAHLCRRYLGGFGPGSLRDISSWAGVPIATLRPIIEGMTLRRFRSDQDEELLDLPRSPLPGPDRKAPVRFLPTWDATLLVHARRALILPEAYRGLVFHTKNPQSVATFLVDGQVAGSWRHEKGRILLTPFAPLPRAALRDLEDEASALAALHA